jgi:hypothetical protein
MRIGSADKTQQIRDRAYQIWQQQGEPEGLHTDHWPQAEQELRKASQMAEKKKKAARRVSRKLNRPVMLLSAGAHFLGTDEQRPRPKNDRRNVAAAPS